LLRVEQVRDPQRRPLLVVVTDGRATGARGGSHLADSYAAAGLVAAAGTASVVVDCESGPVRLGLAATLGAHLGAQTLRLEELAADSLAATVRSARKAA
jgi:magnesium chelatase subunit D